MKFNKCIQTVGGLPLFDLPLLVQVSGQKRESLSVQLHRWIQKGQVLSLRRGLYTLAEHYRRVPLSSLHIANTMYQPSYLSGPWALSYFGMIPENVILFTNVTTRVTRSFQNDFGEFQYRSLQQKCFWGFSKQMIESTPIWIADPEKALLDYFYLHSGQWTEDRIVEMRLQNFKMIDLKRLKHYVERWRSRRLEKIITILVKIITDEEEGNIIL